MGCKNNYGKMPYEDYVELYEHGKCDCPKCLKLKDLLPPDDGGQIIQYTSSKSKCNDKTPCLRHI